MSGAGAGPVNPFPQEERASAERPLWNPETAQPKWYDGMGVSEDTAYLGPLYRALEGAGEGAAKGEELLGGLWHAQYGFYARHLGDVPGVGSYFREMEKDTAGMQQDARERVKAMTPDPATTGAAAQVVHGLASGFTRYSMGALAGGPLAGAGIVGGSEAANRFQELTEQGVTPGAAGASAAVTGGFAAAGALMPAGFGSSLITKILTGAASNAGFGLVSRYADHQVLEAAGYPEMAEQQKVWDSTAVLTDLLLGGGFGAAAHLLHASPGATPEETQARIRELEAKLGRGAPGAEDAALTANLAMRDRASGPGPAVDPQSARAQQAALEKGTADLLQGKPVDVTGTGIENATFAARPPEDRSNVQSLFVNALHESGVLDEERNLRDLEAALGARLRGEPIAPRETAATPAPGMRSATPVLSENTNIGGAHDDFPQMLNDARAEIAKGNFETHATEKGDVQMTVIHDARDDGHGRILAFDKDGNQVGDLGYTRGEGPGGSRYNPQLHVDEGWRRQGIANAMYDLAEKNGAKIPDLDQPGQIRTPEGQAFREARAGKTARNPADAFLHDFELAHEESATHPGERVINGNVHIEAVADPTDPGTVHINGVRAVRPGEGAGTAALEHLTAMADQHDVRLTLDAKPLDRGGIGEDKLSAWYRRFGFTPAGGAEMVREPKGAESVTSGAAAGEDRYTVREEPLTDEQLRVFQGLRSQLRTDTQLGGSRGAESGQSGAANAREPGARAAGQPLRVFRGANRELSPGDFDAGVLGRASGHPSSGLGVFFSLSKAEAGRYGSVTEHYLDIRNPKILRAEDLPGFDSVEEAHAFREKLRGEGYDGLVIDGSHLGGPVNYVAFDPHQALPTAAAKARTVDPLADPAHQAAQENPRLEIPDEQGNLMNAGHALDDADRAVADAERDSHKAILAAINCFQRKGGG